jgi:CheY-like chemotaxis protein
MDGYEVARQIRALEGGEQALLVALTGYGEEEDRQKAFTSGFDEHVLKPASVDTLAKLFSNPKLNRS